MDESEPPTDVEIEIDTSLSTAIPTGSNQRKYQLNMHRKNSLINVLVILLVTFNSFNASQGNIHCDSLENVSLSLSVN